MKLTREKLKQIIKEELQVLREDEIYNKNYYKSLYDAAIDSFDYLKNLATEDNIEVANRIIGGIKNLNKYLPALKAEIQTGENSPEELKYKKYLILEIEKLLKMFKTL